MYIETFLRQIAKRPKNLNMLYAAQEIASISIFENRTNLTAIQQTYLSYLFLYKNLYEDIREKKITELVLKKESYEDAYLYWKMKSTPDSRNRLHKDVKKRRKLYGVVTDIIKFPNEAKK